MVMEEKAVDILLVEDDADDAALTLRALNQRNIGERVFHVMDGDEALQFIFATDLHGEWQPAEVVGNYGDQPWGTLKPRKLDLPPPPYLRSAIRTRPCEIRQRR